MGPGSSSGIVTATRTSNGDYNSHNDQRWSAYREPTSGCYELENLHSHLIIGVAGGSLSDGASVVQWRWDQHLDQVWC
jgi:ricin-type beta-trefoil lectin protein